MADAAYVILTSKSDKTTDNFFIDDEVLASTGVQDFSKYKTNPNAKEFDVATDFMC
jgi:citronellol/citronellal dehydrogenase